MYRHLQQRIDVDTGVKDVLEHGASFAGVPGVVQDSITGSNNQDGISLENNKDKLQNCF